MNGVFLCGAGLRCGQGDSLPEALRAMAGGGLSARQVPIPDGQSRPCFLMTDTDVGSLSEVRQTGWQSRAIASVQGVLQECLGPNSVPLDGAAVYVGASSLDRGSLKPGSGEATLLGDFAGQLAAAQGWSSKPMVVNTACTSAFNALRQASFQIASGQQAEAVILGVETFNPYALYGFESMHLLAPERAEPLGIDRQGMVLGEAVAALRLTGSLAAKDLAHPLGVWDVLACSNVVDGRSPTGASEDAVTRAVESALREAGLAPGDIDLIKLQAAGSPINDAVEMAALRRLFGPLPPCVTFKSVIGHSQGASCAAETALLLACLANDVWPHMAYPLEPEVVDLLVSAQQPLNGASVNTVLLVGLGFGGGHSVLILRRHQP